MRRLACVAAAWFLAGCGSGSADIGVVKTEVVPEATQEEVEPEAAAPDLVAEEELPVDPEVLELPEVEEEVIGPACAPGEGCFLDPCTDNTGCDSGWCVEHMGDGVCTTTCQEECPAGWACKLTGSGGPDVVSVCVSNYANLCRPCAASADCKSTGGAEDACVAYGQQGSFCGGACKASKECPWGFSCKPVASVDGAESMQCVADAGECPCTAKSAALGLSTPCAMSNDYGTCAGLRTCTADGLGDCTAPDPAAEACNGQDEDCDGQTDEPNLVGGDYVNVCDDGNECTTDTCAGADGCVNTVLDAGSCDDADPCTVADHCVAGACLGDPVNCDDENPCTDNVCTPTGGCLYPPVAGECDDAEPCTLGDHCSAGACVGQAVSCDCESDADCKVLEDGDVCNGKLVCDTAKVPFVCVVDPDTVVSCPEPAGPDAVCLASACDPKSGICSFVPANGGMACVDPDACTVKETCADGKCGGGVALNCNDGNPCTDDACDPQSGCVHTDNAAACSDGNVCTVSDACAAGDCVAGAPLACDDGNACNGKETCDPAVGCVAGKALACDDGAACNGTETCDPAAGCVPGLPVVCDDGNPCTLDSCDENKGCVHAALTGAECDDANACTAKDTCSKEGKCLPGTAVVCDDGNVCTTDSCSPSAGCIYAMNSVACDDGSICTIGDHCSLGVCIWSEKLTCDDGNSCTDDSCAPKAGCQFVPNQTACSDGNACTLNDTCAAAWCKPGKPADCDDKNPCTDDSCDPVVGCVHTANTLPCTDGSACTVGDTCKLGQCVPGPAPDCADGNVCTNDSCAPATGCVHENNAAACNDGNACTLNDVCSGGQCTSSGKLNCDDGNACTQDSCLPATGCDHAALTGPSCTDNSLCTNGDLCQAGQCVPGPKLDCGDGNQCTTDGCDPLLGCTHAPVSPCCGNGVLEPGEQCDDGNLVGGDGCEANCTKPSKLIPGNTAMVVERQGFKIQCKEWSGNQCNEVWFSVPPAAFTILAPCGVDDKTSLRPVWHGDVQAQCKTLCWIATGSNTCVSATSVVKTGTATGWMYGGASYSPSCDSEGRQYSEIDVPTVGKQVWSFDKVTWSRNGNFSGYQCQW